MATEQYRCAGADPDRACESIRPHGQPEKGVPCPRSCGCIGQLEIRPSVLYGLILQLSPSR